MRINVSISLAEYEEIMKKTGKAPETVFDEAIQAKKEELLKK